MAERRLFYALILFVTSAGFLLAGRYASGQEVFADSATATVAGSSSLFKILMVIGLTLFVLGGGFLLSGYRDKGK